MFKNLKRNRISETLVSCVEVEKQSNEGQNDGKKGIKNCKLDPLFSSLASMNNTSSFIEKKRELSPFFLFLSIR
jgi:hypothetical protein